MDSEDDIAYYCCKKCKGLFTSKEELKDHKASCSGDSTATPCAMVAMQKTTKSEPNAETPTSSRRSTRKSTPVKKVVQQPTTTKAVCDRKRKVPIGPAPEQPRKKMFAAPYVCVSVGGDSPQEGRRYGLRTKAYDNLKAKLNMLGGTHTVLPSASDTENNPDMNSPESRRKRRGSTRDSDLPATKTEQGFEVSQVEGPEVPQPPSVDAESISLDTGAMEVVSTTSQPAVNTAAPVTASDEGATASDKGATASDEGATENETYPGCLVMKLKSLKDNMEKTASIDKLIQDVKQSLQTQQAVLSITPDGNGQDSNKDSRGALPETVGTEVIAVNADTGSVKVSMQQPVYAEDGTLVSSDLNIPPGSKVNTFNIGTDSDGKPLTVHLVEYKSEENETGEGDQATSKNPQDEKLEALKRNAEGRESFEEFLQKVITAHAENERRSKLKEASSPVALDTEPQEMARPESDESDAGAEKPSEAKKAKVAKPTEKKPKQPFFSPPNEEDYDTMNEIVNDRIVSRRYRCKVCEHETKHLGMMARHLASHNIDSKDGELKTFKCDQCDYTCLFRRHLNTHKRCHVKPHVCEYCCYRTTQQSDLKRHMWRHTGELPFKCHLCDYGCRQKGLLLSHIRKHTGDSLECDYEGCDYKTIYHNSMVTHKARAHTNIRRYSCATCGYQTNERGPFDKHIKVHLGLKENKCPLCNYRAITATDIKRHLRTHTAEKKYSCNMCSYTTGYRSSLRVHLMRHAELKPYQCSECGYASNMKAKVRRHMKFKHEIEDPNAVITHEIKFSMCSGEYVKEETEKVDKLDIPPVMKISYGTRETANVTMDDENNVKDTQIVQQFVIEDIAPDTFVATHQCTDCRFSCKTASSLALHKISYHSDNIVQIVNEEVPVKETGKKTQKSIQLGPKKRVGGIELPDDGNVQEIQCIVSVGEHQVLNHDGVQYITIGDQTEGENILMQSLGENAQESEIGLPAIHASPEESVIEEVPEHTEIIVHDGNTENLILVPQTECEQQVICGELQIVENDMNEQYIAMQNLETGGVEVVSEATEDSPDLLTSNRTSSPVAHDVIPDNAQLVIPDNAQIVIPDNAQVVIPDNVQVAIPDNVQVAIPDNEVSIVCETAESVQ